MKEQTSIVSIERGAAVSTSISKPMQLAAAMLLGFVFIYGAGFVQTSAVHNAAHDARHSLGFPCH